LNYKQQKYGKYEILIYYTLNNGVQRFILIYYTLNNGVQRFIPRNVCWLASYDIFRWKY